MTSARLALALLLTTSLGCVQKDWIDRTLVTESVTGGWTGSFGDAFCHRDVHLDLQQDGSKVTGLFRIIGSASTSSFSGGLPIQGSVAGDVFTFKTSRNAGSGELTVSGDDMTGQFLWGCGPCPMSLHRGDSLPRTESPPR